METKEKAQSFPMKQEEIVPYILLEQLTLAHKAAAEKGKAVSAMMLAYFTLKFSQKLKKVKSKNITVGYCYRPKVRDYGKSVIVPTFPEPKPEQLEQRLAAIEEKLKSSTIFALRGSGRIDETAHIIKERIEVGKILGNTDQAPKPDTELSGMGRLARRVASIEKLLDCGRVFILKGVAEIDELTDIVRANLEEREAGGQNEH